MNSQTEVQPEPQQLQNRPTHRKNVLIGVHVSNNLVSAIDRYIEDQYGEMRRPEAIRKLLIEALGEKYLGKDRTNRG